MKLLYHPTYRGNTNGLDNRRADMDSHRTDRRRYVRTPETLNEARRENRFMWRYLFWEFVVIGIIVLVVTW